MKSNKREYLIFIGSIIGISNLVFIILNFPFWYTCHPLLASEEIPMKNVFSIQGTNEPLRKVLKKISEASGYEIRFNSQLADEKITFQLNNVNLNEAIARILQPYNYMSIWDDMNGIIILVIFKKNIPPVTFSGINRIFELATETTTSP